MKAQGLLSTVLACASLSVLAGDSGPATAGRNVALASEGAMAIADSEYGTQAASLAIDGKWIGPADRPEANRWHAALGKPHPHWVWIHFRARARVARVVIHRADLVDYPVELVGEWSPDGGSSFHELFTVTNLVMSPQQYTIERAFQPVVTDNFRLRILRSSYSDQPNYAQLSEVEVFGDFVEDQAKAGAEEPPEVPLSKPVLRPTAADGLQIGKAGEEIEFKSEWLRLCVSRKAPRITAFCWDSLGEGKVAENLLQPGPEGGGWVSLTPLFAGSGNAGAAKRPTHMEPEIEGNVVRYGMLFGGGIQARWEIRVETKSVQMIITAAVPRETVVQQPIHLQFAFDVSKTPVAPLTNPRPGLSAPLPCLLHAADYGSVLVKGSGLKDLQLEADPIRPSARWNLSILGRPQKRPSDGLFLLSPGTVQSKLEFSVEQVMPLGELTRQDPRLRGLARSWLNPFQYRPDLGILANNVVSDNAIFCMFTFTDPAVFTPPLPGKVEAIQLARASLDRYFAGAPGYGVGLEDIETDTYPSLLISAWDVIRVTGDRDLLGRWLPFLERFATRMEAQDRNGNGLPESTRSGLPDTAVCPTGNWWDQINFGHEDAYVSALAYRALGCLADLERLASRPGQAAHYQETGRRIKAAYLPTFLNPKTGILAGWRDTHGDLHDYWFVFVNGMAITYGLVPNEIANQIVDRFEAKLREVGYARFDLGLPGNLVPIPKRDYGKGGLGSPQRDDGQDTFGVFENGGASACYAYFYTQALYQLGRRNEAERILWPMLQTFAQGGFQNGVGHGGEWRRWDGRPSGYEGFLADAYYAQLALFTGHYGIGFGPEGFRLEPWSPWKGKRVPLGLKFMGKVVAATD